MLSCVALLTAWFENLPVAAPIIRAGAAMNVTPREGLGLEPLGVAMGTGQQVGKVGEYRDSCQLNRIGLHLIDGVKWFRLWAAASRHFFSHSRSAARLSASILYCASNVSDAGDQRCRLMIDRVTGQQYEGFLHQLPTGDVALGDPMGRRKQLGARGRDRNRWSRAVSTHRHRAGDSPAIQPFGIVIGRIPIAHPAGCRKQIFEFDHRGETIRFLT